VRDSAGNAATRTASLTVAERPRPPASETPAPAPGVVAPRIESLHLTTARIRPVGVRARLPRATRLQVRATGADQITVEVAGKGAGPAKVTLTRPVTAGGATVTLRARIGHRTLTPGRYVVSVVAHGAAGASAPARTTLRVG
jgi:hypothetical protein